MCIRDRGSAVRIAVTDDGQGVPPDFDLSTSESLGLQIVRTLVTDDLKGELTIGGGQNANGNPDSPATVLGTKAVVTFPKRTLK